VTNLNNNRSIVVRVNDRGPFHGDRIVDLSYAAALKLGYAEIGTTRVQLDAIIVSGMERERTLAQKSSPNGEELKLSAPSNKYLQVGAFSELGRAQEVSNRLREMTNRPIFIREVISQSSGVLHRVRIGPVNDETEIRRLTQSLVAADLGSPYTVTD
jgi:rare lipoprotein A